MSLVAFARKHARVLIGLVNLALVLAAIQLTSARSQSIGPKTAPVSAIALAPAAASSATRPAPASSAAAASKPSALAPHASSPAAPASLPIAGKGMWIWLFPQVEGGDPARIVWKAQRLGLTHLYVRSSSTTGGLKWLGDINRIVPVAHAAGIKVIAWDFPRLANPRADAQRIIRVIDHRTPSGDRVDGIAVDLETAGEGVHLSAVGARILSDTLKHARPSAFRVLVPPRPSPTMIRTYPYSLIPAWSAVAPMVYWHQRDAGRLALESVRYLKRFGRPVAPIGQAYNSALDPGGQGGSPNASTLVYFAQSAVRAGAVGVSFWSWQHASTDMWRGIARIHVSTLD
jgi:hypothetical protein